MCHGLLTYEMALKKRSTGWTINNNRNILKTYSFIIMMSSSTFLSECCCCKIADHKRIVVLLSLSALPCSALSWELETLLSNGRSEEAASKRGWWWCWGKLVPFTPPFCLVMSHYFSEVDLHFDALSQWWLMLLREEAEILARTAAPTRDLGRPDLNKLLHFLLLLQF